MRLIDANAFRKEIAGCMEEALSLCICRWWRSSIIEETRMKAVLISIKHEWCSEIVLGKKTMELRKTRPKLETPFKVYIYCTKCQDSFGWLRTRPGFGWQRMDGKVVAEFICDQIYEIDPINHAPDDVEHRTGMNYGAIVKYLRGTGYGWNISHLKVYDAPKELNEFGYLRKTKFGYEPCKIKKAPQSWCYVAIKEDE